MNDVRLIIRTFKYCALYSSISELGSFEEVLNICLPDMKNSKKKEEFMKLFIDFNKSDNILYDNLYIGEYKIVIKFPIGEKDNLPGQIRIEKFSLINGAFLTSY